MEIVKLKLVLYSCYVFFWSPTSLPILTYDPWHQPCSFLHTTAAHWTFASFGSILCKLWRRLWCGENSSTKTRRLSGTDNHVSRNQSHLNPRSSSNLMLALNFSKSSWPRLSIICFHVIVCFAICVDKQINIFPKKLASEYKLHLIIWVFK